MRIKWQKGWRLCLAACLALMAAVSTGSVRAGAADQPGDFDLYVLSLSWSPDYCASHRDDAKQCAADRHFGLVVHGLWPQFATPRLDTASGKPSNWPAHCPNTQRNTPPGNTPPAAAATIWPSLGLFRHEWQTHGTCSGLAPADFVDLTGQLRQRFQTPSALQPTQTDRPLAASDLRQAILGANPGLPVKGLQLFCHKNRLAEIRLCLGRDGDHAYTACPATMSREDNCPAAIQLEGLGD